MQDRVLIDLSLALQISSWATLSATVVLSLLAILFVEPFYNWIWFFHSGVGRFLLDLYRSMITCGVTFLAAYFSVPWHLLSGEKVLRRPERSPVKKLLWIVVRGMAPPLALVMTTFLFWESDRLYSPNCCLRQ